MVTMFYLICNLLALISIRKLLKFLNPFEIICYWNFISILSQEFFVIVNLNLEFIKNTDSKVLSIIIALNRLILIPIIIMWLLFFIYKKTTVIYKIYYIVFFAITLTAIEYLGDWLGLITHKHWKVWWAFSEWLGIVLLTLIFSIYVKRLYKKEVVT